MPYPRYGGGGGQQSNYGHGSHQGGASSGGYGGHGGGSGGDCPNPWQRHLGGGQQDMGRGAPGDIMVPRHLGVDPMALVGNLVGVMMGASTSQGSAGVLAPALAMAMQGQQQQRNGSMMGGGSSSSSSRMVEQHNRDRAYDRDREIRGGRDHRKRSDGRGGGRDRTPPPSRTSGRSRSRDRGRRSHPRDRRRGGDTSPERHQRAEHEIYIGNYPVKFRESDVRKLFEEYGVEVGAIRMKHDGLKVFAFAETSSTEQIDKAKNCMEGKEIQGRKLRVRSSKDSDKKRDKEKRDAVRMERRRSRSRYKPLKREDTKLHLVAAFHSFLCRQIQHVEEGEQQEFVEHLETAKTALQSAFKLPEDVTKLKVPRDLEDIFFRDVREDIKPETVDRYSDNKEDNDEDDNKRKNSSNGNDESEETSQDNGDVVGDVYDEENDLDDVLAAAEEGFTLDD